MGKENYKHLAYNPTTEGASLPLGSFFGSGEVHPRPQRTLGEIARRLFTFINPVDAPAHMSEHHRPQPASVAVSQSVEVSEV